MRIAPTTNPGVEIPVFISEGKEVAKRTVDPTA
jgi:cobalamin biosynthesis protein CbiD